MKVTDKILFMQSRLLKWFESSQRIFPWRQPNLSNYQIIISEVLLQRTKAETISKLYDQFILDYPDWQTVSNAYVGDLEEYLRPIGLYKQRASRLQNLAKYMVENVGVLPQERSQLNQIPFMGQYIANAVELQIFNKRLPLLDVNMTRVIERYFGPRQLVDIRYDPYLQKMALKIVDHPRSKEVSWAILDFSASICKARKPLCSTCPISANCLYFKTHSTGR